MSKADLVFYPSERVTSPDGRTLRYWGKYPAKTHLSTKIVYVFFDVETDQCVELHSSQVLRLRRVKTP